MTRIPTAQLWRYLLSGRLSRHGCLQTSNPLRRPPLTPSIRAIALSPLQQTRSLSHALEPSPNNPAMKQTPVVPLRKQLKDEAKAAKAAGKNKKKKKNADNQTVPGWELTVGIEIHAQLNTARKLFSAASTSFNDDPNTHVALFDVAVPGSHPRFQQETLIPALRAALALNCDIQKISHFDRKHYFHWDQPSGYQITQYYEPFAKNGYITLYARDGIAAQDGEEIRIGIQQIQMEQDTGKTIARPGDVHLLDFNRVGAPLIEIITLPQMHHPATAAALVRKIQLLLNSVDSCVSGMESGGLRADVNVSVRRADDPAGKLGQRTEIKNLSSFKAVEDAIIAERDRQIAVIEAGGVVLGETRGWSLGSTETRRLRGKEGEVDYRYMPDPDLGPVVIGDDLVSRLAETMGALPDAELDDLIQNYGLSSKDAVSLMLLDQGGRIQFFYDVVDSLEERMKEDLQGKVDVKELRVLAGNWVLHELGRLTSDRNTDGETDNDLQMTREGQCRIRAADLAEILAYLLQKRVTARVAKELLFALFRGDIGGSSSEGRVGSVTEAIERDGLWFDELTTEEYGALAEEAMVDQDKVLREFVDYRQYPQGKLMFLVGKMMRLGPQERIDPATAEKVMKAKVEERLAGSVR
ncbi:uncharacterized protein E0L32_003014 [Thyridium curvatum]|uniref:Glutamyl-tRNA(Gln) amidotransferase subunit B, mitochondrial n=1 Tax=Thyridium curvatum TaxID=1093900 RepID=A0A507BEM0_9PEZI|nr:uncharacterized protein E0L32_003014 [Thyridium curvatum]TPX17913.1 hypothetical protein E0L32_003014 [Thyridium curvatum]